MMHNNFIRPPPVITASVIIPLDGEMTARNGSSSSTIVHGSPAGLRNTSTIGQSSAQGPAPVISPCKGEITSNRHLKGMNNELNPSPSSSPSSGGNAPSSRSRCTRSKAAPGLRRGKWTDEEEQYCNKIIEFFKNGTLDLDEGTSLRNYLADKLNCEPMRITKKFVGSDCIGKQMYHPPETTPELEEKRKAASLELHELERKFHRKLEMMSSKPSILEISSQKLGSHYNSHVNESPETSSCESEKTDNSKFISRKRPLHYEDVKLEKFSMPRKETSENVSSTAVAANGSVKQDELTDDMYYSANLLINFSTVAHKQTQQWNTSAPNNNNNAGITLKPISGLGENSGSPTAGLFRRAPLVISRRSKRPPILRPVEQQQIMTA